MLRYYLLDNESMLLAGKMCGKIEKEHYFYQLLSKEKEIAGKWLT